MQVVGTMISSAGKEASQINNQTTLRRCSIRKRKIRVMVATTLSRSKCSNLRTQLHQMHQQRQWQQPRHHNQVAQINQTKIDSLKFLGLTKQSLNEVDIH